MIPNFTIGNLTIDCANAERTRSFYADLFGYEKTVAYGCPAVKADRDLTILFAETDVAYLPPVWPEEQGEQQKQMHLDFTVVNLTSAVEKAVSLGAAKAAAQYGGDGFITLLDTEGHPFCLCKGTEPDISINVDCQKQKSLCAFYAGLAGWDQYLHYSGTLVADNGMIVCFQGCDNDATMDEYIPPVWPEQDGKQQKQMHFNFQVDDLQSTVEEAISLGARKPAQQYGGGHFVTLLDTAGHPFCLCARNK